MAERIAHQMRTLAGTEHVHLHLLAKRLGVTAIEYDKSLLSDGCTTWCEGLPSIRLKPGLPSGRRRFTLAHELTHVMLGHGRLDNSRRQRLGRGQEERLCDATAAALLMPKAAFAPMLNGEVSLSSVLALAGELDVSVSAAVVRLNELSRRPQLVLVRAVWSDEARWVILPPIGMHGNGPVMLSLPHAEIATLKSLSRVPRRIRVTLEAGTTRLRCTGEADRWGTSVLALFSSVVASGSTSAVPHGGGRVRTMPASAEARRTSVKPGP